MLSLWKKDKTVLMFYITTKLLPEGNLIIALFIRHTLLQVTKQELKTKCKSCSYDKC